MEHAVSRETNFRHHLKRLVHQRDLARKMDNPERAKQLDTLLTEIKKRHVERTRSRHRAMNTNDRAQFEERVSQFDDERQNQRANNAGTRSASERARRSNAWDHRRAKRTERRNAWSDRRSQHRGATSDRSREKRSHARANTRTVRFDLHTSSTAGSKARPKNAKTSRFSKSDRLPSNPQTDENDARHSSKRHPKRHERTPIKSDAKATTDSTGGR